MNTTGQEFSFLLKLTKFMCSSLSRQGFCKGWTRKWEDVRTEHVACNEHVMECDCICNLVILALCLPPGKLL